MKTQQNEKLWDLIKDMRAGMLVTAASFMHARPMSIVQKDFDGTLWFMTGKSTGTIAEIKQNAEVCVSFAEPKDTRYVSITGHAELSDDRAKIYELWNPMASAFFDGKDDPEIILIKVHVEKAEYWNVEAGRMEQAYEFLKAQVTGKYPDIGENRKIG